MNELEVKIVKLEPMRVASFHAYGNSPELDAAQRLVDWAKPLGLLDNPEKHRIFGFNNPSPSPGSPNYGYEFWITIEADMEPESEVDIKEIPVGLYAVTRCDVKEDAYEVIPETWKRLAAWRENSKYGCGNMYWLEEYTGPFPFDVSSEFTIDLYFPITD
jgi:AraC family transcriptional regulator